MHHFTGDLVASSEKHKVADGREISMDRVAKPTHHEPPRLRTYPQGTHGWVLVHYSAMTMCLLPVHF